MSQWRRPTWLELGGKKEISYPRVKRG
ncbi:hypothetical protein RLOC_00005858, partial [Lonchura striata]